MNRASKRLRRPLTVQHHASPSIIKLHSFIDSALFHGLTPALARMFFLSRLMEAWPLAPLGRLEACWIAAICRFNDLQIDLSFTAWLPLHYLCLFMPLLYQVMEKQKFWRIRRRSFYGQADKDLSHKKPYFFPCVLKSIHFPSSLLFLLLS